MSGVPGPNLLPPGLPDDPIHRLADQLNATAMRLQRLMSEADSVMFLTAPQTSLLSGLVRVGPQAVGRLAEGEGVSSPAITQHVDKLERRGLVERVRRSDDRRVVEVRATEAGEALLDRGRAERIQGLAARIAHLTPAQQGSLTAALGPLVEVL